MAQKNPPLVLMILDGWGYREQKKDNAIASAHTPQWDTWWAEYPHMLLEASGQSVGLPGAQMGNSEVGHMHIGAGRVIQQDFTRINQTIERQELIDNPVLQQVCATLKKTNQTLHLMGLLSPGGVHSHEAHLFALIELCAQRSVPRICLHLFLDGRDTPPQSAIPSIERLNVLLKKYPQTMISSISGRYYAMDRDNRWERIEPVYDLLTQGKSVHHSQSAEEAIASYYQQGINDEFIPPTAIGSTQVIKDNDAVLFFNFRADRARQLSAAFIEPQFNGFSPKIRPQLSYFLSMTQYSKTLKTSILFPPLSMSNTLGEVIAQQGLRQLRIAETEKYAHVTFFFNGGQEQIFPMEDRILIPSPKVATYDLQPEMSARELTERLVAAIHAQQYDVIICNYANADMVGHSGNLAATITAIECLDQCMQQVGQALAAHQGQLLITADHGNAEQLFDEQTHQAHTAHTSEPVPFLFVGHGWHITQQRGSLIDIAPTILHILGIPIPAEMTGHALLEK